LIGCTFMCANIRFGIVHGGIARLEMRQYRRVYLAVAAFSVLMLGYELGKVQTQEGVRAVRPVDAATPSGTAIQQPDTLNSWQKLAARRGATTTRERGSTSKNTGPGKKAELPSGPFGSNVADLKQLADAGNADAAFALAKGFRDCEFFVPPKTDAEVAQRAEDATVSQLNLVDQIVDEVKSTAQKQGRRIDKIPEIPVQPVLQENLRAGQEQVRQCAGVDTKAARDWLSWQRRAAELGNVEAELTYWDLLLRDADVIKLEELVQDKPIAIAALQDALSHGDARALIAIAEALENGEFDEPDPYLAYAYFFAATQAPYADVGTLPWIGNNIFIRLASGMNTQQFLQRQLNSVGSSLSASQQLSAQQLGMSLFLQCCQSNGT
jgi:hypothetical protein